jgi:phosphoribosyl-ATP pyrophosphohydrolase
MEIPYGMDLNTLAATARDIAEESGWHGPSASLPGHIRTIVNLALIGTEVSEAIEAVRHDNDRELAFELADIIIRTVGLAAIEGIDLDEAVVQKMQKNRERLDVPARAGGKVI